MSARNVLVTVVAGAALMASFGVANAAMEVAVPSVSVSVVAPIECGSIPSAGTITVTNHDLVTQAISVAIGDCIGYSPSTPWTTTLITGATAVFDYDVVYGAAATCDLTVTATPAGGMPTRIPTTGVTAGTCTAYEATVLSTVDRYLEIGDNSGVVIDFSKYGSGIIKANVTLSATDMVNPEAWVFSGACTGMTTCQVNSNSGLASVSVSRPIAAFGDYGLRVIADDLTANNIDFSTDFVFTAYGAVPQVVTLNRLEAADVNVFVPELAYFFIGDENSVFAEVFSVDGATLADNGGAISGDVSSVRSFALRCDNPTANALSGTVVFRSLDGLSTPVTVVCLPGSVDFTVAGAEASRQACEGDIVTWPLDYRNTGTLPVEVGVSVSGTNYELSPQATVLVQPGNSIAYTASYSSSLGAVGSHQAEVTWITRNPIDSLSVTTTAMLGVEISPTVTLSSDLLEFSTTDRSQLLTVAVCDVAKYTTVEVLVADTRFVAVVTNLHTLADDGDVIVAIAYEGSDPTATATLDVVLTGPNGATASKSVALRASNQENLDGGTGPAGYYDCSSSGGSTSLLPIALVCGLALRRRRKRSAN